MSKLFSSQAKPSGKTELRLEPVDRRSFLRVAGASAAVTSGILLTACSKESLTQTETVLPSGARIGAAVDLGSGDVGILNYAYALEQLEAAFYKMVIAMPYMGMSEMEKKYLTDIRDHEIVHRNFFKKALGSAAIPDLEVDFSAINFKDRSSVLGAARDFEDLGVAAYNGAGKYLMSPELLTIAGKIVSVEARHASIIRYILFPDSGAFAGDDILVPGALDRAYEPGQVLPIAQKFVKTMITANNLPKMA